jgi:hypothetical protein
MVQLLNVGQAMCSEDKQLLQGTGQCVAGASDGPAGAAEAAHRGQVGC